MALSIARNLSGPIMWGGLVYTLLNLPAAQNPLQNLMKEEECMAKWCPPGPVQVFLDKPKNMLNYDMSQGRGLYEGAPTASLYHTIQDLYTATTAKLAVEAQNHSGVLLLKDHIA